MTRIGYAAKGSSPVRSRAPESTTAAVPPIARRRETSRDGGLPCSFAQEQFWYVDQLAPGTVAYNFSWPVRLRGQLDVSALEQAVAEVVRRHDALRTRFVSEDGRPVQVVDEPEPVHLAVVEVSDDETARRLVDEEGRRPFNLRNAAPFRATLLRLGDDDHIFQIVVHHIVSDEQSKIVLFDELSTLYAAYREGLPSTLPEPGLQLADFAEWQRSRLTEDALTGELAHWVGELAGLPASFDLPADRPRPSIASLRGGKLRLPLPADLLASLQECAHTEGATFFDGILALYEVLLHRYTGQEDFVVGVPVDDRTRAELEDTVGVLLGTSVVRSDLAGLPSFRELLRRVRQRVLDVDEHADLPFERLVRELQPERDLSRHPLFQVLFAINPAEPELHFPGIEAEEVETEVASAGVDLFLFLQEVDGGFDALWEYSTDLFDRETVERIHRHFVSLLRAAVAEPDRSVGELAMLTPEERKQLLAASQGRRKEYWSVPIHVLVERQAARTPGEIAVDFEGVQLTYAELDARANQLARHLQQLGVAKGSLVGISLDRSLELPVGLLAILKTGGAYVPLDPELPAGRFAFMLEDSGADVILIQDHLRERLSSFDGQVVAVDSSWPEIENASTDHPGVEVGPGDIAYVIYTSGSTGKPKGVLNIHGGIANRLLAMQDTYRIGPTDRLLQKTQTSFDVSVREIFWPLIFGARLVVAAPGEHGNPAYLADVIEREQITTLHFVPSMLQLFLDETDPAKCRSVRCVLSGGEALTPELARRFFERLDCELHNLYGPTEAAVSVTSWQCRADDRRPVMPIGRPIANTDIFVVDSRLEPAPVGVWGELLIGGVQVAHGYHGRPDLTAERFLANPFGVGRVYRTGDLGRWTAEGLLEYGGRIDEQVKLRGFRIELGEIETVLREFPPVADGAVVVVESAGGRQELAAYVVPESGTQAPSHEDVHRFLGAQLPEYMVPTSLTFLDALPLSPSGKLDRKALPAPDRSFSAVEYAEPETATEQAIAELWGGLLEIDRVGRDDNFFRLGGHSLLAAQLVGRVARDFEVELPLCTFLQAPTIAALAREIEDLEGVSEPELPPLIPTTGAREASFAQERFWLVDELMGSSAAYNIPFGLRLRGELDAEVLERALTEIVRRHEILRTRFSVQDGRPQQVVEPPFRVQPTVIDLTHAPDSAQQVVNELTQTPIGLTARVLFTVHLLRLDQREHILHLVFSHAIFDGWSKLVFLRELEALYNAFSRGSGSPLENPGIQFADYADWQRSWLKDEPLERELAYWTTALAGIPDALELPTDRARPAVAGQRGAWMRSSIPGSVVEGVQSLARSEGTTLYTVLLAVFDTLLHRYSGQDDIVVGMPVEGRDRPELEDSIGVFVDTVVLRVDVSGNPTLRELTGRVRTRMLDAIAHQRLPFEQLVRALAPERQLGRHPLYQVMLTLVPAEEAPALERLEVEEVTSERASSPIDLTVFLEPHGSDYEAVWEYDTDLFDATTIARMQSHFLQLLTAAIADPDKPIAELEMLSAAERELALTVADAPARDYPVACLHELFEGAVAATPDAPAVEYEGETLSYRELNSRANRLAHRLRALGVERETLVALCLERSPELVIAILAVLKAGGAYVPLDPDYPADRLAFVLQDAHPRVLLTHERLIDRLPSHDAAIVFVEPWSAADDDELDELNPEPLAQPGNLAYVIYTSGSTGQPKGVLIEHRHVARLFSATDEWFEFGPDDTWLLFHSYAFDFSVWELWGALLHGGRLVVAPLWTTRSPEALARLVAEQKVTVLNATPTLFVSAQEELLRAADELALRYVVFGGEALQPSALDPWFKRFGDGPPTLVNMYGITETTVHVTYRPLTSADANGDVSPIGGPIPDLQLYLLDDHLNPVAPGVPGELYVGGAGVARGYLNRPELTAQRFVSNPFGAGVLYRSGDRGRYRGDGELEFLGRADDQVKIRGFRVELGEIQAALNEQEAVGECAVVPFIADGGDARLAAYVVPSATSAGAVRRILQEQSGSEPNAIVEELRNDLRTALEQRLPLFMVPASITLLPSLPLTANGKLDRKSLPAPVWEEQSGTAFVEPRTPTATAVAEIWQRVLGVERVGNEDNFFRLGGHSLLAARTVTQVRERFEIEISVRALFEHPTLDAFAEQVAKLANETVGGEAELSSADSERSYPLAFSQRPLLVVDDLAAEAATYNGAHAIRIEGDLDLGALGAALEDVIARHETLRTVFNLDADEPAQIALDDWPAVLEIVDLGGASAEARDTELQRLLRMELRRPFDLRRDPMMRTTLFRLTETEHVLLVVTHHIASDGWSVRVFFSDLGELYDAHLSQRAPQLSELPLRYRDFVQWQRERLSGPRLERERDYWRTQLSGAPTTLDLLAGRPRPSEPDFAGATLDVRLPAEMAAGVQRLADDTAATPYMVLLSVFGLLLYRVSGQDDILVGSPYANRARTEFDNLIGFFANTLAMRVRLAGNPTFTELLVRVREMVLGALDHQEFPFEHVVSALRPVRQPGMNPLVQVNFRASVEPPPTPTLAGVATSRVPLDHGFAAFDLALDLSVLEDGIVGEFIYDVALFDRPSVERFADAYSDLLRQLLDDPDRRLLDFEVPHDSAWFEAAQSNGKAIRGFRGRDGSAAARAADNG